ncbi:cold shock CspA family protein [Marinoscillum furvescens DSM 4134]|uniref:Cold shock CspA family protein n=2 Tax=Marinoscillum furvescens TaxID=1026 RepID=A0A3D9LG64_MARFU|nr:cold shock CspA family protein [Marinoscillum furvescens DSM 4134]
MKPNIVPVLNNGEYYFPTFGPFLINILFLMNTGKVKFFNDSKGYGFIKEEGSDKEYFVHVSGLIDEVRQDDDVTFELKEGKRGLNAVNVKLS